MSGKYEFRMEEPHSAAAGAMLSILVVAALYPLCLWFANLKQRRKDGWLSYL